MNKSLEVRSGKSSFLHPNCLKRDPKLIPSQSLKLERSLIYPNPNPGEFLLRTSANKEVNLRKETSCISLFGSSVRDSEIVLTIAVHVNECRRWTLNLDTDSGLSPAS